MIVELASFSGLCTLLEKQSKYPWYNMKWRGIPDTTWTIPRTITFSPLHILCYIAESRLPLGQCTWALEFYRGPGKVILSSICNAVNNINGTQNRTRNGFISASCAEKVTHTVYLDSGVAVLTVGPRFTVYLYSRYSRYKIKGRNKN